MLISWHVDCAVTIQARGIHERDTSKASLGKNDNREGAARHGTQTHNYFIALSTQATVFLRQLSSKKTVADRSGRRLCLLDSLISTH